MVNSLIRRCVLEEEYIIPLKGYGRALEQKCCFSWLIINLGTSYSASTFGELNPGHVVNLFKSILHRDSSLSRLFLAVGCREWPMYMNIFDYLLSLTQSLLVVHGILFAAFPV